MKITEGRRIQIKSEELPAGVSTLDETLITSNISGHTQRRYNLRPNRTPNYLHRFAFLSVKTGIKKWGEWAKDAVRDEL